MVRGESVVFLVVDDVCVEDGVIFLGEDVVDFGALGRGLDLEASAGGDVLGVGMKGAEGVEEGQWR